MTKERVAGNPLECRKAAVERLKNCDSVTALAAELGVNRRTLYRWRAQLKPGGPPGHVPDQDLRAQLENAKRLLADKTLEADFFRGALQKIEARRQRDTQAGETASTTKSGS